MAIYGKSEIINAATPTQESQAFGKYHPGTTTLEGENTEFLQMLLVP